MGDGRREVRSEKAPAPVGPYSQAVVAGDMIFVSGQIPIDPATGEIVSEPFSRAVEIVLNNIKSILEAAGSSMDDVVKVTVYMRDLSRFQEFNEVYKRFFREPYPARSVVGVDSLPRGSVIEIEVVAVVSSREKRVSG